MQSKRMSLIESAVTVGIGSIMGTITHMVVFPFYGVKLSMHTNFQIAVICMVVGLAQKYIIRRLFNRREDGK